MEAGIVGEDCRRREIERRSVSQHRPVHEVIVYSRKQCHLCDEVKEKLRHLDDGQLFHWREIDIDSDPQLQALYGNEVPVVFIDGRKSFKYRLDEREFLRKLQ